jgi:hypothetical protein
MLPTVSIGPIEVTRLICGGNPFSGFSHFSAEMDREMVHYYSMPRLQECLEECWRQGINTFQSRGDRHQMRAYIEHWDGGGQLQWLAQTASEFADISANIREIAGSGAVAIYHHGTHTDNCWHAGRIAEVADIVKRIKDAGLPAGLGTHIPEVIRHAEDNGWETDFYMACLYNLARGYKAAPATEQDAYACDRFPDADPDVMGAVIRQVDKPCLAFKIMAANRNCGTPEEARAAFARAFDLIKPADAVVVGMFQKHKNQVAENAAFVRDILGVPAA